MTHDARKPPPSLPLTESQWQGDILKIAKRGQWDAYHTYNSKRSKPGFPDLLLIRPPELVIAEIKTDRGKTSPEQDVWLAALAACGLEVYVWRPRDIEQVSQRLLRLRPMRDCKLGVR